jgi:hypothetical protein
MFENEQFGFSIKYEQTAEKITLKKKIYVDTLMVEEALFEEWNKMVKKLKNAYKEVIIIKKNKNE